MRFADILRTIDRLFTLADAALGFVPGKAASRRGQDSSRVGADGERLSSGDEAQLSLRDEAGYDLGRLGGLEARLAGVVVAALREAFDRDSARLDVERAEIEAQQRRADQALRLERLRQLADREVGQIRTIAVIVVVVWITSAVFVMVRAASFGRVAVVLLGAGWVVLLAALGLSFGAYQRVVALAAADDTPPADAGSPGHGRAAAAAFWLATVGFGLTAFGLLAGLTG